MTEKGKTMTKRFCDICGNETKGNPWYEVTERTILLGNRKIDVCQECIRDMRRKAKAKRDGAERKDNER